MKERSPSESCLKTDYSFVNKYYSKIQNLEKVKNNTSTIKQFFSNTSHKPEKSSPVNDRHYLFQPEGKIIYKNLQSLI